MVAARGVEGHDCSGAEISDQQLSRMPAKRARSQSQAPRRIDELQLAARIGAGCEACKNARLRIQNINQAVSAARDIIVSLLILLRKCDKDVAGDGLHIE